MTACVEAATHIGQLINLDLREKEGGELGEEAKELSP